MFNNQAVGARCSDRGSVLDLSHVEIESTRQDRCIGTGRCFQAELRVGAGTAFLARGGGRLIANIFVSRKNSRGLGFGLDSSQIESGVLEMHQGLVELNAIGIETIGACCGIKFASGKNRLVPVDLAEFISHD